MLTEDIESLTFFNSKIFNSNYSQAYAALAGICMDMFCIAYLHFFLGLTDLLKKERA